MCSRQADTVHSSEDRGIFHTSFSPPYPPASVAAITARYAARLKTSPQIRAGWSHHPCGKQRPMRAIDRCAPKATELTPRKDGGMRNLGRGGDRRLTGRGRERKFESCGFKRRCPLKTACINGCDNLSGERKYAVWRPNTASRLHCGGSLFSAWGLLPSTERIGWAVLGFICLTLAV